jgi:hypothetical protein
MSFFEGLDGAPDPKRHEWLKRCLNAGRWLGRLAMTPRSSPAISDPLAKAAALSSLRLPEAILPNKPDKLPSGEHDAFHQMIDLYAEKRGAAEFAGTFRGGRNFIREQLPRMAPRECRQFYEQDICGNNGLVAGFNVSRHDFGKISDDTMQFHLADPITLWESVASFRQYTDAMSAFAGRPIESAHPQSGRAVRNITPELIATYELFGDALTYYAGVVEDVMIGKAEHREATSAAQAVCMVVNPMGWERGGNRGQDQGRISIQDVSAALYLQALIPEMAEAV